VDGGETSEAGCNGRKIIMAVPAGLPCGMASAGKEPAPGKAPQTAIAAGFDP